MSTAVDVLATPTHCQTCGHKRSDNPLVQSHVRCPVCLTPYSMAAPEATLAARLCRYPALRNLYGIEAVPGFPLTQTIYDALHGDTACRLRESLAKNQTDSRSYEDSAYRANRRTTPENPPITCTECKESYGHKEECSRA